MQASPPFSKRRDLLELIALATLVLTLHLLDKAVMPVDVQGLAGICGAFLLAWALLRLRGQRFADVGLRRPPRPLLLPLWVLAIVATAFLVLMLLSPLLVGWFGPPDYSRFLPLIGNTQRFLITLVVVWVTAAFFEEMVFRGFALDRLARLLGEGRGMVLAASAVNALGFGLVHAYQGPMGIIQTGVIGFIFSLFWFATGRNLWALIVAHGLINSWSMWQFYSYVPPQAAG
jgi:uncharacterized protein